MDSTTKKKKPNYRLRRERVAWGWTQHYVAEQLGADTNIVSRWESGERPPSLYYQEKLCALFGKNAAELGLIEQKDTPEPPIPQNQTELQRNSLSTHGWIIPFPPQPYFAHPYPLQENFTGRIQERQILTEWLTEDKRPICALVALGGMGKSSLAWAWLQQNVLNLPDVARPQGVLWWSFYEAEATFTLFLDQALIYAGSGVIDPANITSIYEKTRILITLLQRHHLLLILDGFERGLRAYANLTTASHENDIPEARQSSFRVCIDQHLGNFLRWSAAGPLLSKILLTTRLFPHELDGLVGCRCEELSALKTKEAADFLLAQGVRGTRVENEVLCKSYGNHPLTLRLLTGLIVNDPAHPRDVAVAAEYNPLPELIQRKHHILSLAYDALHLPLQQLLSQLAAFRSKVNFRVTKVVSPFDTEKELKVALRELVERGLLFFDREQGNYDFHPLVRQYAYTRLLCKEEVHTRLVEYFWSKIGENLNTEVAEPLRKIRAFFTESSSSSRSHIEHLEDLALSSKSAIT